VVGHLERKNIYKKVEALMEEYCNGCFLYKQNRKDYGRNYAHKFCITKCTVGEKIKEAGEELTR